MIRALPRDPWGRDLRGKLHQITFESKLLVGNPLGDPSTRPLWIYTPPRWSERAATPAIYCLQGMTGQVDMWQNRTAFQPTFVEAVDAQIAGGECPPVVLVMPDCWTSYGGSQFLDSAATGHYASYVCEEIVAHVDAHFRTVPTPSGRAVMGKSSGGYGALVLGMRRPDLFGALGAIAADSAFEFNMLPELPVAWATLRTFDGDIDRFWAAMRTRSTLSSSDFAAVNCIAMSACYSPSADGAPLLPFDTDGRLREDIWARWLEQDPARLAPTHLPALRQLRHIAIEAGLRDEFHSYMGAQQIHAELTRANIAHRFELFDGGHFNLTHRSVAMAVELARSLLA